MNLPHKSFLAVIIALAVFVVGTNRAGATFIDGTLNFDGSVVTNSTSLATSTQITSYRSTYVAPDTQMGTYTSVADYTLASFTPFSFSSETVFPLWTFTVSGITYSFDATSVTVNVQSSHFLDISGTGFANVTGYAQTPGTFTIDMTSASSSSANKTYTFGASFTAAGPARVPETASVAILIVLGFTGVALALRKPRRIGLAQAVRD